MTKKWIAAAVAYAVINTGVLLLFATDVVTLDRIQGEQSVRIARLERATNLSP